MSNERNFEPPRGILYETQVLKTSERKALLQDLENLHPIWEERYSKHNPPPAGAAQRRLLRPVYWLGNWQFACLNYYHPPKGIENRCVRAEAYPESLEGYVRQIEEKVREHYTDRDLPRGWKLNTCLVNYYGSSLVDGKWQDVARVGEHKDFEPGPVASLSFGERALFQFVASESKATTSQVRLQMWLEDNSLQIFGGDLWKKKLFHRVQRVETKGSYHFGPKMPDYQTRRINLTFRYVPEEHIQPFHRLPQGLQQDVLPYMEELAMHSKHFKDALAPGKLTVQKA